MIAAIGIDPGEVAGLACLTAPSLTAPLYQWQWLTGMTVRKPSQREAESHAERELRFADRLSRAISPLSPAVAVIERPSDAASYWSGQGQRGNRRGTSFALGVNYAAAVHACSTSGISRIASYLVLGRGGDVGWMPRRVKREHLLQSLAQEAERMGAPHELSDHILMAFGVLGYHLKLPRG